MRFPKLKEGNIYRVVWRDNNIPQQKGWMNEEAINNFVENEAETKVRSVGYFLRETRNFITLFGDEDMAVGFEKMRLINIIKSNIVQIQECSMKKIFERE
jgi:hypothetical protein